MLSVDTRVAHGTRRTEVASGLPPQPSSRQQTRLASSSSIIASTTLTVCNGRIVRMPCCCHSLCLKLLRHDWLSKHYRWFHKWCTIIWNYVECVCIKYVMFSDPDASFPTEYPTACLLGCVDVVDCLEQDEYRSKVRACNTGVSSTIPFHPLQYPLLAESLLCRCPYNVNMNMTHVPSNNSCCLSHMAFIPPLLMTLPSSLSSHEKLMSTTLLMALMHECLLE